MLLVTNVNLGGEATLNVCAASSTTTAISIVGIQSHHFMSAAHHLIASRVRLLGFDDDRGDSFDGRPTLVWRSEHLLWAGLGIWGLMGIVALLILGNDVCEGEGRWLS
jgi:hypothetical protein